MSDHHPTSHPSPGTPGRHIPQAAVPPPSARLASGLRHRLHTAIRFPARPGRATLASIASIASIGLFATSATAAPFLYQPGDLVLLLRQAGNASDLVVNLGSVTGFAALSPGESIQIDRLDLGQLASAFPSLNGLQWSVAAASRPPGVPGYPLQTLWVTAPRTDPATEAAPWLRKGSFVQGNAASQVDAIGANAALVSSLIPGGPDNTATGVALPVASSFPIAPVIGPDANYAGTFQGRVEAITPDDFESSPARVARADLFELVPGTTAAGTLNQPGRRLGFFELTSAGALSFHVPVQGPAAPSIASIRHLNGTTTITFTTEPGFTYRLRRTDPAGLASPPAQWTASTSVTGTGSLATIEVQDPATASFYRIEVLP